MNLSAFGIRFRSWQEKFIAVPGSTLPLQFHPHLALAEMSPGPSTCQLSSLLVDSAIQNFPQFVRINIYKRPLFSSTIVACVTPS